MATGWKKASVQYRKVADISGLNSKRLQGVLSDSMKHIEPGRGALGDDVQRRQCTEDPEYGTVVLNFIEDDRKYFFGELVRFEPGADLPLLQLGKGKVYNLTQAKAPDGHEAVRGVFYFMVIADHVIVLENGVVSARAERYFTWLLNRLVRSIPDGSHVILDAELTTEADGRKLAEVEQVDGWNHQSDQSLCRDRNGRSLITRSSRPSIRMS